MPGWTMFVVFFGLAGLDHLLNPLAGGGSLVWERSIAVTKDSPAAALLVAGAGVPVGFVLYQIYFFFRWSGRWAGGGYRFRGRVISHGRIEDLRETIQGVELMRIERLKPWRRQRLETLRGFAVSSGNNGATAGDGVGMTSFRQAWYELEALFIEAQADNQPSVELLYRKSRELMDVVHGLGTSIFGIIGAAGLYVSVKWYLHRCVSGICEFNGGQLTVLVLGVFAAYLIGKAFYYGRENARNQMIWLHRSILEIVVSGKDKCDGSPG